MKQELFEFLCLYFPRIFTQKHKKAFRQWLTNYLNKATDCQQSGDYFFRKSATHTLIVDISTPEWLPFGKDHSSLQSRLRYMKIIGMLKIVLIIIGALGIFVVTRLVGQQQWLLSVLATLVVGCILLLGFGIPHRYNFSKLATLATVIDCFVQNKQYNLFIVDSESQLYAAIPSVIKTKTISSVDDLYIGEQGCFIEEFKGKKYYTSFTKINGVNYLPNKQRRKSDIPPKSFYEELGSLPKQTDSESK